MAHGIHALRVSLAFALAAVGPAVAGPHSDGRHYHGTEQQRPGWRGRGGERPDATDTLEQPSIEFVGEKHRPKLKICPAGGRRGGRTWTMLSFEGLQEVDAEGVAVESRFIRSLQELDDFEMSQEKREVGGAMALVTRLSVGLKFSESCANSSDLELTQEANTSGSFAVETYLFVPNATASVDYGNDTVEVLRGQMKFNIVSMGWPFCGEDHKLEVRMHVEVEGGRRHPRRFGARTEEDDEIDKARRHGRLRSERMSEMEDDMEIREEESSEESRESEEDREEEHGHKHGRRRVHGKRFIVGAGDFDLDMDLPTVALVDGVAAECDVELDSSGDLMAVDFTFPFFAESMVYDPVVGFVDDENSTDTVVGAEDDADAISDGTNIFAPSLVASACMPAAAVMPALVWAWSA